MRKPRQRKQKPCINVLLRYAVEGKLIVTTIIIGPTNERKQVHSCPCCRDNLRVSCKNNSNNNNNSSSSTLLTRPRLRSQAMTSNSVFFLSLLSLRPAFSAIVVGLGWPSLVRRHRMRRVVCVNE
mmetsp:Transcript_116293/g.237885  ORF Transcript_116293/g.237885 Transcript_116293/m.237885 type:complete len:125 (+) Transcript_116293:2692-3066(+)